MDLCFPHTIQKDKDMLERRNVRRHFKKYTQKNNIFKLWFISSDQKASKKKLNKIQKLLLLVYLWFPTKKKCNLVIDWFGPCMNTNFCPVSNPSPDVLFPVFHVVWVLCPVSIVYIHVKVKTYFFKKLIWK